MITVKQKVLSILEEQKGESISGTSLANNLSVSRNAVWKAIKSLQGEGYDITAVTNKGYCLSSGNDILSEHSIKPYLNDNTMKLRIEVHKSVGSTNTLLKELAINNEAEGKIIIAEEQTEGRGRFGRSFYSPSKTGIYMSILLRPKMTAEESLFITTSAAVAVAKAIEKIAGCQAKIKWVNDIYCDGKKVCGILTEAAIDFESGGLEYAVLGIGINILKPENDFPVDLKAIATSILKKETYLPNTKSQLIAEILNNFFQYYYNSSNKEVLEEYRNRSFLLGKEIMVMSGGKEERALAKDIDDKGQMVVEFPDGTVKALNSGEVSILPVSEGNKID